MSEEGSPFRTVVILVLAAILVLSAFTLFDIAYPVGRAPSSPSGGEFKLFLNQFNDTSNLGINVTDFHPATQKLVLIEGYVLNGSSNTYIGSSKLFVAMAPYETQTTTGISGFYQYYIRYAGHGHFSYMAPGYKPSVVQIDATGSIEWVNASLSPMPRYPVHGSVKDVYGNYLAGVEVAMSNLYQTFSIFTNASGGFSFRLYNASYLAEAYGSEFATNTTYFNITGSQPGPLDIVLRPNVPSPFFISGTISNSAGKPLANATVSTYPVVNSTTAGPAGNYRIPYLYGNFEVNVTAPGYNSTSHEITALLADEPGLNIVLSPVQSIGPGLNLFSLSGNSGTGDPAVNASALLSLLAPASGSSPSQGSAGLNITFRAGSVALTSTQYIAFFETAGIYYRGLFSTDSAGAGNIALNFSGVYNYALLTFYYGSFASSANITGFGAVTANFVQSPLHNMTVNATNVVDNFTVPASGISVSNSIFLLQNSSHASGNRTVYTYAVPDGQYVVTYSNPGYISASSSVNISGRDNATNLSLLPFIINILNNSNMTLDYTVYPSVQQAQAAVLPNSTAVMHAFYSQFTLDIKATNIPYYTSTSVNVTTAAPVGDVYFNGSVNSTVATPSSGNCSYSGSSAYANMTFAFSGGGPEMIWSIELLSLNFSVPDTSVTSAYFNYSFTGNTSFPSLPFVVNSSAAALSFQFTNLTSRQAVQLCKVITIRIGYSSVDVTVSGRGYAT